MHHKKLLASLSWVTVFLAGAAMPELTPGGKAVQTLTADVAARCESLGPVGAWKWGDDGGLQAAEVDIRNRIAAHGGNAIVVKTVTVEQPIPHAEIAAESFRCGAPAP